jgi:hypothetical protein
VLDPGPAASLLVTAGGGTVVGTDDAEAVAHAILDLLRRWRGGEDLSPRIDPQLAGSWERSKIAAQAAEILDSLASSPRPAA